MNLLDEQDARAERQRADELRAKQARQQHRADVRAVLGTDAGRRLVFEFLQYTGVDHTALRDSVQAMGHAAGWQDAGRWWLQAIRDFCPEREAQMRAEANRAPPESTE